MKPTETRHEREIRNNIEGDRRLVERDASQPVRNPATGETLATVSFSTAADVDEAVRTATVAFES